jgi:hypothetical protein
MGKPGDTDRYTRFFTIRYDRRNVDASLDIPDLDPTVESSAAFDDLELTTVSASYGIGY